MRVVDRAMSLSCPAPPRPLLASFPLSKTPCPALPTPKNGYPGLHRGTGVFIDNTERKCWLVPSLSQQDGWSLGRGGKDGINYQGLWTLISRGSWSLTEPHGPLGR